MVKNNNKRILKMIKNRLELGAEQYYQEVPLNDGRDFIKETLEELLDACVYLSAELLKFSDKVDRWSEPENPLGKDY